MAQALGLHIPEEQLQIIAPVLDALWAEARRALDRDLSHLDPALYFHAGIGVKP
jgi:hypothetical protein